MKIAINTCFGGFSLSKEAYDYLGLEWDNYGYKYDNKNERSNIKLIECIEKLGEKANGLYANIKIIEIPDNIKYYIYDYDGKETIHEEHRSWS